MKRLAWLAAGVVSIFAFVLAGFAPLVDAYSSYGSGTIASPYRIATCSQLKEMANDPGGYYELVSNIDCTGTTVAPVGNFTGTFDGRNHTIANITITGPGLFALATAATIKNATLSNGTIVANGDSGSFVGWAISNCALSNLHSNLAVPGNGSSWIGGLVGILDGGSLSASSYSGTMSGGADTGGLVGALNAGSPTISDSYFTGTLTANSLNAGGLVGEVVSGTISNSYSAGTIHVNGQDSVGGLIGFVDSGATNNSFAANIMSGTGTNVGAVFGQFNSPGTRINVHYDQYLANDHNANSLPCAAFDQGSGNCTAENVNNAAPGYFMNTTSQAPLNGWDFTGTWTKTVSYPVLQNLTSFNAPSGIPHGGDANGDGILDSYQGNVTNIQDSNGVWSTIQVPSAGLCTFDNTSSTLASAVTTDSPYTTKTSLDGFWLYCPTVGMSVPVTVIYPTQYNLTGLTLRYYNPATHLWSAVPDAVFANVTIGGTTETEVTYTATDRGALDQDGRSNGIIVDPVALAAAPGSPAATLIAPNTGIGSPASESLWVMAAYSTLPLSVAAGIYTYVRHRGYSLSGRR
ncbi:MAG TPA: choice-of-anchor U domain-containing protein [Candidatus Saccharimonadales bacterium]|nr:choice-of-anchor U domain-containing protein [Candidatus Saccharimonadales bacterium]